MDRLVRLQQVTIRYGGPEVRPVLENVSLDVGPSEFIVVFGMSGVGKSSLLRIICDLMQPDAGSVEINVPDRSGRRPFGFVFQEPRLFPWRKVGNNVALGLEGLDLTAEEREERVRHSLNLVGLSEYADRYPRQLSGGQKQRVGIARALAVRPSLLLMDEPFSSLDAVTRRSLQEELMNIWRTTQTSVLFVTHDVEEAVFLADRVVLLAGEPAHVTEEYHIESERPRHVDDKEFQAMVRRLREDLYAYQNQPML
jgi:NitT/TauT family transport system ATP-binding protein